MACSKDPFSEGGASGGAPLRFNVIEGSNSSAVQSRSDTESDTEQAVKVFRLQGATPADTMFLHMSVSEGIDRPSGVSPEGDAQTRAAETTVDGLDFGLLATAYTGAWNRGENEFTPDYIYNVHVYHNNSWTLDNYFWPVGKKLRLCAYGPWDTPNVELSEKTKTGDPTLTYTAASNLSNQRDLVVAVTDVTQITSATQSATLKFQHVLTGVRIKAAADMPAGKISKVSFQGIHSKSILTMGYNISWTGTPSNPDNRVFEKTFSTPVSVGNSEVMVLGGDDTFMLLPQTLPSTAELVITYTDNTTGKLQELRANIGGTTWDPGRTVTYAISTSSSSDTMFDIELVGDNVSIDNTGWHMREVRYDGGSVTLKLDSYSTATVGGASVATPESWEIYRYSMNDGQNWTMGNHPAISLIPISSGATVGGGSDGNTPLEYTLHVAANKLAYSTETVSGRLQRAAPQTSRTNLANGTTANCYIISRAGDYCFPLVYGNGLLDGRANESAFKYEGNQNGSTVMFTMYDHAGNTISNPRIWENGYTPHDAVVVWSDAPDVISDVRIAEENSTKMMYFTITQDAIRQCNAILAVRDASKNILWSWHIWVTDLGTQTVDVYPQDDWKNWVNVMKYPLGYCEPETASCDARTIVLQLRQTSTQKLMTIRVHQKAGQIDVPFRTCYYQWGRKDPMCPATGNGSNMTLYYTDAERYTYNFKGGTRVGVSETIKNPHVFYGGTRSSSSSLDANWIASPRINLWDNGCGAPSGTPSKQKPVKTIYDPSPKGFCIPPPMTFSGVLKSGTAGTNLNSPRNTYDSNYNFEIYRNDQDHVAYNLTYLIPALGYRSWSNGNTAEFHYGAFLHTCQPMPDDHNGVTWITPSPDMTYTFYSTEKATAGIVMPVQM